MDEYKATKVLAKEIVKHSHISIIREEWDKKNLIDNSLGYYQTNNPFILNYQYIDDDKNGMRFQDDQSKQARGWCFSHYKRAEDGNHEYYSSLEKAIADKEDCIEANYFFVQDLITDEKDQVIGTLPCDFHFFVTPYYIIGEKEKMQCKKLFYKDVNSKLLRAIETLQMPNYIDIYKEYRNLKQDNPFTNLKIRTLMNDIPNYKFDQDGEIKIKHVNKIQDLSIFNLEFERLGLKSRISITEGRKKRMIKKYKNFVHKKTLLNLEAEIKSKYAIRTKTSGLTQLEKISNEILKEFYDFAFSLPYEDQNIEANKFILRANRAEMNYIPILIKEYAKGEHFMEYFECLDSEQQKKTVIELKSIPNNKPKYNQFLWEKGFKGVTLDHKELYYSDSDGFIDYFKSKELKTKKAIFKDIMNCDYTNKQVTAWLEKNEHDLMLEVSMDG